MSTYSKKEILEQLEAGKIDATEAAKLLSQIASDQAETTPVVEKSSEAIVVNKSNGPSTFHVRVRNLETGENKVTVNIPLRMLKFGLKLGGRFSSELEGLDFDDINEMMADMDSGMLVEVQDEESKEHVQVYID